MRTCVLEDQYGFILHYRVMQKETDEQVAVAMVTEAQNNFLTLKQCSYDKGFHSKANQEYLRNHLELVILPKKGRRNKKESELENSTEFKAGRRQHSAVESAINALQVHGLNKCPDHGIVGFKRYVALGVLAWNIQNLGTVLGKKAVLLLLKQAA